MIRVVRVVFRREGLRAAMKTLVRDRTRTGLDRREAGPEAAGLAMPRPRSSAAPPADEAAADLWEES